MSNKCNASRFDHTRESVRCVQEGILSSEIKLNALFLLICLSCLEQTLTKETIRIGEIKKSGEL